MKFTTSIKAINPHTDELTEYRGQIIEAKSWDEAQVICDNNFPYCIIDGEYSGEQTHFSQFELN